MGSGKKAFEETSDAYQQSQWEKYDPHVTGSPNLFNLWQGGPKYRAMTGASGLAGQQDVLAQDEFGTKDPAEIAKALTLERLQIARNAPQLLGPTEEEIADVERGATGAAGEVAATTIQQAGRDLGRQTGGEAKLRGAIAGIGEKGKEAAAMTRATAGKEVERNLEDIYAKLVGAPPKQPSALASAALDVTTGMLGDAGELGVDWMRESQLGLESRYQPGTSGYGYGGGGYGGSNQNWPTVGYGRPPL
jgi:hypothetical protein